MAGGDDGAHAKARRSASGQLLGDRLLDRRAARCDRVRHRGGNDSAALIARPASALMSSPLRLIWLRSAAKALAVLLGVLLIGRPLALAQSTPPAGSTPVELTVVGGTELNPNAQGRASPVVVRIFELAGTAAFEAGDF